MKTIIILSTLLATTAIAGAQPSLTDAAAPAPAHDSQTYVEGGAAYGVVFLAATVEVGHQIDHGPLWFHAMLVDGSAGGIDETTYSGSIWQARAGIEARRCVAGNLACAVAGVDAAVSHVQYMAEYDSANVTEPLVLPRVGLDLGGDHVRLRPGAEIGVGGKGLEQIAVTAGVAYQW